MATHVCGTAPARAPALGDTHEKKDVPNKVREHSVRDALSLRLGGTIEVLTPSGCIDCLTENEVIEVKQYRNWKSGIGQVLSYGSHYPSHKKRLHLFAHKGERASKYFEMATSVCSTLGIHVTFQETLPDSHNLDGDVALGADEGAAATSGGSAASKKHLRTEDSECRPPAPKKARTGATYVTVSLKLQQTSRVY